MRIVLVCALCFWASVCVKGQAANSNYGQLPRVQGPAIPYPQYHSNPSQDIQQNTMRMLEQDRRNYELEKQRREQLLREAYKELGIEDGETSSDDIISKINHGYSPNKAYGKIRFEKAFHEINDMIEGRSPYNLKRAVFLTEYAYDTTLNYAQFERQIAKLVEIIQLEMKQRKIPPDDNVGKIMAAFRFMADTLKVQHPVLEKTITTYPKTYDFEDFYGMRGYRKMFVSKLIRQGKGQCHSLPLLFLILCQEIKAKAYLSFSPEHSYVKFLDKMGNFHNIELTNQMFTTDQFIMQSGYVTSAAIKSKVYMDTLALDRMIVHMLNDLSNNYVKKYGYDDFVLKCADRVLLEYPNSIHATMHVANYYTRLGLNIERQYQYKGIGRDFYFNYDEEFRDVVRNAIQWQKHLDELGYAEMPPEMYSKWLNTLKNESMRQEHIERKKILTTMSEF